MNLYNDYIHAISNSNLSIYSSIEETVVNGLYIPTEVLETILKRSLVGLSLAGYPLRTRSKVVKEAVCQALGYPIPRSFKKCQPRFPAQNFDVYSQKSLNVQIWNEEVNLNRRYVFLGVDQRDIVFNVRVITGAELVVYDKTGTLTTKYQATMQHFPSSALFTAMDTPSVQRYIRRDYPFNLVNSNPNDRPIPDHFLTISEIYKALTILEGYEFEYIDALQERNRGAAIHSAVCKALGYGIFEDNGTYPDIFNQLLEIKLQTSPTIDLGLHSPTDGHLIYADGYSHFYSHDIRYAIFDSSVDEYRNLVRVNNVYVTNGANFISTFPLFGGKAVNAKLQLPLPSDFFNY